MNSQAFSSAENDIFELELVKQYDVPDDLMKRNPHGDDVDIFSCLESDQSSKQFLNVDNKGNVVFFNPIRKIFLLNNHNLWKSMDIYLSQYGDFDSFEFFKIGQECIVFKKDENIFRIIYDGTENEITSGKELKHKALDIKGCDLSHILLSKLSKFILLFYQFTNNQTIIVWDCDKEMEDCNFTCRREDEFKDYLTGKNSKLGFLCFNNYIVDLDTGCIPNPFINQKTGAEEFLWCQGTRINNAEDMLLNLGAIVTPICCKDIYYSKINTVSNLDIEKVNYYINKKSVAYDFIDDFDEFSKILDTFKSNPVYYSMLVLENLNGKTPLDIAIENNITKVIDLILNSLVCNDQFATSRAVYKRFPALFQMNLKAFVNYLNKCYFITPQMKSITKVKLENPNDTIREIYNCCILDKSFYKDYCVPGADPSNEDEDKSQASRSQSHHEDSKENENNKESKLGAVDIDKKMKRVIIKGIEFDWIYTGKDADQFLKDLGDTDDLEILAQPIIKDIILYQWKFYKINLIRYLLIPYCIYFWLFCVYVTWIIKEVESEKNGGTFTILGYITGCFILLFNLFWGYVETTQLLFHKLEYFKSFWNILDLTSLILNVTNVLLNFANANYEIINRTCSISVLILYFKLFYFLRIFFATGYLIGMIIEIVIDMKYFLCVLIISACAFGNSFWILGRNSSPENGNFAGEEITDGFIFSYRMILGDFQVDGFGTKDEQILWILFLLNTIILTVVLLNLVIAIMGDTFDRVQKSQESTMLKELVSMILENEFLISRQRTFNNAKYIVIIEPEKVERKNVSWDGKLGQLKNYIEQTSLEHTRKLKSLQEYIDSIVDEKMNQKLSICELRLQKITRLVEDLINKKVIDKNKNLK